MTLTPFQLRMIKELCESDDVIAVIAERLGLSKASAYNKASALYAKAGVASGKVRNEPTYQPRERLRVWWRKNKDKVEVVARRKPPAYRIDEEV